MIAIRIGAAAQRSSMEHESRKRARAEERADGSGRAASKGKRPEKKRQQNQNQQNQQYRQQPQQQNYHHQKPSGSRASCSTSVPLSPFLDVDADISGCQTSSQITSDTGRPMGVFEFPWLKERLALDVDGWEFRDVFFSSLVDGCSARIGLPGDRLGRRGAPFTVHLEDWLWTLAGDHEELDGADCIWSCALQQPLLATGGFSPASVGVGTGASPVAAPATANAS